MGRACTSPGSLTTDGKYLAAGKFHFERLKGADEAAMKRTLARRAADTYVLASAEKLGAASRFAVLPFDDVAGIITDADESAPIVQELAARGVVVSCA